MSSRSVQGLASIRKLPTDLPTRGKHIGGKVIDDWRDSVRQAPRRIRSRIVPRDCPVPTRLVMNSHCTQYYGTRRCY